MNKFICKCGKVHLKGDSYTKWNHWVRCSCGERAFWEFQPARTILTKFKDSNGSSSMAKRVGSYRDKYEGYNEALGVNVRSKTHHKQLIKEMGLEERG